MKILHAITSIDKGGAENHLTSLAKIQKDNHFDVNIFYTTKSDYWKSFYATNGIRVHKSCYVLRANLISKIIKFYSDIIELIEINKRFKPDVIHAHLRARLHCLTSATVQGGFIEERWGRRGLFIIY